MKRITLLTLTLLWAVCTFAQNVLVTPPATATTETWYRAGGNFYVNTSSGFTDATGNIPTVNVIIDGSDIYIQRLAYWFKDAWIKGTISGTKATFANGQFIGEDEYGPEYICGSNDGEILSESIEFDYDATKGTLTAVTRYIVESGTVTELSTYCYWNKPTFSKTEPESQLVKLPEGVTADEYAVSYTNTDDEKAYGYVNVGFDGSDVYIQGLCSYLPEAWLKGTLEGTKVTFAGGQFLGTFGSTYDFYLQDDDVVCSYDATTNTFALEGSVCTYTGTKTIDNYKNPVIKKVVEKAGTPSNPTIYNIEDNGYGDIVYFVIPTVDTDGNPMASQKLSFQFFYDIEKKENPLTFTPDDYKYLEGNMSVIPYGFTDDYDFYNGSIYLNMEHSKWNRIGIQSIYTGGGEEHKSEVVWYVIKPYGGVSIDFNAMDVICSKDGDNAGDIIENVTIKNGGVTLTISPMAVGATPNRFWSTSKGPQLRVYSGTLTFEVPADKVITEIVFNAGKWNNKNSADTGSFAENTWTGEASKVVVTIAGNTQINSIDILTTEYVPMPVEAPDNLETATYIFDAKAVEAGYEDKGPEAYTDFIKVGFDGNDAYIQGLSSDEPELWVKATKNEAGQYVISANQYMGTLDYYGYEFDYFFTAVDAEGNMIDVVFDYDAEAGKFSTAQTLVLNGASAKLEPYMTFTDVTITKFVAVAATPADPTIEAVGFTTYGYPYADFDIPATGTNNEILDTGKLFYTVWVEKNGEQNVYTFAADPYYRDFDADMTEIPYTYDGYDFYKGGGRVYFEEEEAEFKSWTKIGIQSIYYGGGECHKSNIVWAVNSEADPATAIAAVRGEKHNANIYDLSGRKVVNGKLQSGIYIVDGKKMLVK